MATLNGDMVAKSVELVAPNKRKYAQPIGLFINNEFVPSRNEQKLASIDPTDASEITSVYAATVEDVDIAVKAARRAFNDVSWRDISPTDRGNLLIKLSDLVAANAETLATIEAWDSGKPYSVALADDMCEVKEVLKYYGGYADKIHGQVIDTGSTKLAYTIKGPVGVCGQIIPWNYPLAMAAWKLGPALACGNTIVIKAAEQTPLSLLYLATLVREAGFPPGVVNILNGHGREAGAAIASHLDIDKVAFTGSTSTGKEIMKMASVNMKNITLETGGKSPLLIFADADLEQAIKWAHLGVMSNSGQICTATSRILVEESIYESFVVGFQEQVKEVSIMGNPFEESTFQGPQVTQAQYERVLGYISSGLQEGAIIVSGGEAWRGKSGKGLFITPAIFINVKPSMRIYREEIFGPVVVIAPFKSEQEALEMANNTTFGLGAAVFTQNITRAHRVANKIEAGTVWINSSNDSDFRIPFGGIKQSGIGRELGELGLAGYCQTKAVHINLGRRL